MSFFSYQYDPSVKFDMYTPMHVLMLGLFLLYVMVFVLFKDKIYESKSERNIRYIVGSVLTLNLIILVIIETVGGHLYLPFHLCSISYILTIILLFTKNKTLWKYVYFAGILGGLISFAIPDLYHAGYNRFRFYEFIIAHGSIILIPIYFLLKYEYRVSKKDMVYGIIITNILGFSMLPVNILLRNTGLLEDANFMFTMGPPSDVEAVFGSYPYHFITFELVLIILFGSLYLVTNLYQKKKA